MRYLSKSELAELIRNRHHIYYLYAGDKIVYIGQTKNLLQRLAAHLGDKDFDKVGYYVLDGTPDDIDLIEAKEIIKHRPRYNKSLPIPPETFGLIKEKKLPRHVSSELRDRAFFMVLYGVNYYDGAAIKEALVNGD